MPSPGSGTGNRKRQPPPQSPRRLTGPPRSHRRSRQRIPARPRHGGLGRVSGFDQSGRFRAGAQWREVPSEFGAWTTVSNRFRQWRDAGVFEALLETPS
ncbi:transposase [Streptomyces noursei]|uniref:transposase n=1 Tax=Streptomyces noursei TaxID=1971 RepID=UPI003B968782